MNKEKDCSACEHCEIDYDWDDETGDEYPIYICQKGNDTSLDYECKDFEKYKPQKYKEENTECDICEYREKCEKYSSGIDCTTYRDTKTHIIYPRDKCIKKTYDCTDFNNSLEHGHIDIDQWLRLANTPTDEEIKVLKMAKGLGVEIPKDIENYFKKYGVDV